jgi:WhiB family redox-sensing transcriptional regulator
LDIDWMSSGQCRGLPAETMFPADGAGVAAAKKVCAQCLMREPCLEYALTHRIQQGVWGGASVRERQRLLRYRQSLETLDPPAA